MEDTVSIEMSSASGSTKAEAPKPQIFLEDIIRAISRHYGLSRAMLFSPLRSREIVFPRQLGMYLAKTWTSRSLPEIGRKFGNRDHTTVLHSVRKVEQLIKDGDVQTLEALMAINLILDENQIGSPHVAVAETAISEGSEHDDTTSTSETDQSTESGAIISEKSFERRRFPLVPSEIIHAVCEQYEIAHPAMLRQSDEASTQARQMVLFLGVRHIPERGLTEVSEALGGMKYMAALKDSHIARRLIGQDAGFALSSVILEHNLGFVRWGARS